jgi:Lrp/AsnC family transcriptional regulator for asnA, asnC and gidA
MDELDKRLIAELRIDPRRSNSRLAQNISTTEYSVRKRINNLVTSGELVFIASPDLKRFGYTTSAYLGIKVNKPANLKVISNELCASPQLHFVARCDGFADFFVRGIFNSTDELAKFISKFLGNIDGISQVEVLVELKLLKRNFLIQRHISPLNNLKTDICFDDIDRQLVLELQKDCRAPLKTLAGKLNIGKTTIHRRIKHLITSGTIVLTAITTKIGLGYIEECFMGIETELQDIESVAATITNHPQVGTVGIVSGSVPLVVSLFATSSKNLLNIIDDEITQTNGVKRIKWLIHTKVLKRTFSWLQA